MVYDQKKDCGKNDITTTMLAVGTIAAFKGNNKPYSNQGECPNNVNADDF